MARQKLETVYVDRKIFTLADFEEESRIGERLLAQDTKFYSFRKAILLGAENFDEARLALKTGLIKPTSYEIGRTTYEVGGIPSEFLRDGRDVGLALRAYEQGLVKKRTITEIIG